MPCSRLPPSLRLPIHARIPFSLLTLPFNPSQQTHLPNPRKSSMLFSRNDGTCKSPRRTGKAPILGPILAAALARSPWVTDTVPKPLQAALSSSRIGCGADSGPILSRSIVCRRARPAVNPSRHHVRFGLFSGQIRASRDLLVAE
jgi:hypothetical protein